MACLSEEEHQKLRELLQKLWDNTLEQLGIEKREPFQGDR